MGTSAASRTGRAIRPDRFSFRLMSYAVLLHHFLPESKDVWIVRVDGRAYPMGVGMAERRDSREVLDDPLALRADERLVNAEDVRIPVNVNHWLAKRERFFFQRGEEGIVAGLSPACWRLHGERPESVSFLPVGGPGGLKVRVRLRDDHHRSAAVARRQIERFAHPGDVGGVALFVLGVHLRGAAQVVVAADNMERKEHCVPVDPARVLPVSGVPASLALPGQLYAALAEARIALEEHLPQFRQPLEGFVSARLGPVTVDPFVVPHHVDERMLGTLRTRKAIVEGFVAAGRQASALFGPCLAVPPEIPVVDYEGEVRCIDVLHQVVKFLLLASVVRHVADQRKIKARRARLAYRSVGGATAEQ